ncbi:hypothetical protein EZ821_05780 [Salmonella enterica subsp. enterica serovar Adelaide]|uniref:Phosphoribosyltransferase n=1 Tax=Salmonella enterica TaxID=28901 RepID=A0A5V3WIC8_SALER|nr:hypothetical protein [Salmonella enterica]EBS2909214.1 hypothetical protein [Salmonella enterica subsp. enterica serovar Flottbek]EBV1873340.1 hypothetical protein [Salmonella enterica subsp. enterica serovar Adelaide]ECC9076400.1 hypothetical protein [Salmonella enterica subsp. enterica]EDD5836674.1 hypothetical protein [Salmonella enterica subsp. enterica serovar Enteritidis]EDQ0314698.1 hypothetical protein [Salmonella enterica subsp. enterica serovar Berta]EDR6294172.1 hypothetical pro
MTFRLTRIDELIREQHYYLEDGDLCYFFGEYTARQGAAYSETNQLIMNLKKGNERRGLQDYRYKGIATERVARMITSTIGNLDEYTFVPVPPSKCQSDAAYDDRMTAILRIAQTLNPVMDYRELVLQNVSTVASHASAANRPSPDEIMANYRLDENLRAGCRDNIVIFDDVLTAGSHFKAMKRFLLQFFPEANMLGLFVARTARDADMASLFDVLK